MDPREALIAQGILGAFCRSRRQKCSARSSTPSPIKLSRSETIRFFGCLMRLLQEFKEKRVRRNEAVTPRHSSARRPKAYLAFSNAERSRVVRRLSRSQILGRRYEILFLRQRSVVTETLQLDRRREEILCFSPVMQSLWINVLKINRLNR
jgi:hypothetical protein